MECSQTLTMLIRIVNILNHYKQHVVVRQLPILTRKRKVRALVDPDQTSTPNI